MNKLTIACEMSINDWIDTFPDIIPEAECSKKHEKWKRNLFNKMRDGHYHRMTTKTIRILLVAAILLVILFTAFVFPSSRESFMNSFDEFSMYKITRNNKNCVSDEIKVGYIPEGYVLESTEYYSKHVLVKYQSHNKEYFTVFKYSSSMEVDFDTEICISEEIYADGIQFVYSDGNEGINNIVWTKNDYVYRISGTISKQDLVKIAKFVN